MSNAANVTVDMSGLNEKLGNLMGALIGTGQGGDIHLFLRTEAAQLAWDIGNSVGPIDTEHARAGINKSLSYVFRSTREDGKTALTSNLDKIQRFSSYSDFNWFYAWSRNGGGVVGVRDEDDLRRGADAAELRIILNAGLKFKRGNAYTQLGKRGNMHIMQLNRKLISKSGWNALAKQIMDSTGKLRASFAATAEKLMPGKKRIPNFVKRHIKSGTSESSIFDDSAMSHPTIPSITFGSNAKGVMSNPYVVTKIEKAVANRTEKLRKKMEQIIAGYTYEWNTGAVFKKKVQEGGMQ